MGRGIYWEGERNLNLEVEVTWGKEESEGLREGGKGSMLER